MIIMGIIDKYFEFKKNVLLSYNEIFFDNEKNANKYLLSFIETYINTYYFHLLDTYYDTEVLAFDDKIMIKELQGKRLELLDEIDKTLTEEEISKQKNLIEKCYKFSFISIIIDLTNYTYCNKISDFRDTLKQVLIENKRLIETTDELIEKLSVLVKDNVTKERKFFLGLKNDTFDISYYSYKDSSTNFIVELDYQIDQLERNYTKKVLEKNYNSPRISYEKLIATTNLVQIDLLNRILRNKKINHYFINCPLEHIHKKETLEEIVTNFSNPRVKNNVVFIINYNDYISNKSLFKNLKEYRFALLVDLTRTMALDKKLDEIDSYDIFSYVIINGIKKADYQLVENYIMHGKEMFMNEFNMM